MFKYSIGEQVYIRLGDLQGTVTGRAEYDRHPNTYQVHHIDGNGNPVYSWVDEQDLVQ